MSWNVRYWLFAALTWIAVRVVTGSPVLATLACSAMCWTVAEDRRQHNKINLMSSQNVSPNAEKQ